MLLWFWPFMAGWFLRGRPQCEHANREANYDPWTPKQPPLGYISDILQGVPISASISRTSDGRTLVSAPVGMFTDQDLGELARMADKAGGTLTFERKS